MSLLDSILRVLGLKKRRRPAVSDRARGNECWVIEQVRTRGGFPSFVDDGRRRVFYHAGERRISGLWAVRAPWDHTQWVCGWYDPNARACYVVRSPTDEFDYDDRVERHEIAHDCEWQLRLAPPWHYRKWASWLFNWGGGGPTIQSVQVSPNAQFLTRYLSPEAHYPNIRYYDAELIHFDVVA